MKQEEKDKKINDGWNKLYQRLEQEGLLPDEQTGSKQKTIPFRYSKWAIAMVVLLLTGISIYQWQHGQPSEPTDKQVLQNDIGVPTLVASFEDGSTIYLAEQTSIEYPSSFNKYKREVSLSGDAFFEITGNPQHPFIIHTPSATIEVLGTSFNVKSDESSFSLWVKTGKVKVTSRLNGETVYVNAGETALLTDNKLSSMPTVDDSQFTGYLQHIHFKDQPLSNIIRILNERSHPQTLKLDPKLANRLLTVTFFNESPESIALLICKALNLRYLQQPEAIYITSN